MYRDLHRQRGELSLLWCAVFFALFACGAMALLFSWRYDRNVLAEGWASLLHAADRSPALQQTRQAAGNTFSATSTGVNRCRVNGVVTYSNVECDAKSPDSRKIDIQDTRGFEPPKAPAVTQPDAVDAANSQDNAQGKAIEKLMRH